MNRMIVRKVMWDKVNGFDKGVTLTSMQKYLYYLNNKKPKIGLFITIDGECYKIYRIVNKPTGMLCYASF